MTRLFLALLFLGLVLPQNIAFTNPWVSQTDELKITGGQTQSRLDYRQSRFTQPASYVKRTARKTDKQIYLEYGLNDKVSLIGKILDSEYVED